jgi:hypothetical protein
LIGSYSRIIYRWHPGRKCANGILFFAFSCAHSSLYFSQEHLRNIAGGVSEHGSRVRRVEVYDPRKKIRVKVFRSIHPASSENHKGNAVLNEESQTIV